MYNRNFFRLIICFWAQSHHIFSQFLAISTIFCHKFVHYNNQIYPNLCIVLTIFTLFYSLRWRDFPKVQKIHTFVEFNSKYLQICGVLGINVTYAHDNREFFDYIVENNQKRLIFANTTEKWYTWRVFTCVIGKCKKFLTFCFHK